MKALVSFMLFGLSTSVMADTSVWQDLGQTTPQTAAQARGFATLGSSSALTRFRSLRLDEVGLRSLLTNAQTVPGIQARATAQSVSLPLPDGSFAAVTVTPVETLTPEAAAAYPDIQTWEVQGVDGKVHGGAIDFTSQGFHAMLQLATGDTVFIDPQTVAGQRQYASFSKRDNAAAFRQTWSCATHGGGSFRPDLQATARVAAQAGQTLRTYRLAVGATAEYTAQKGGVAEAASAIATTINRVNQILKRDFSIALSLVNNTAIIGTDTATDGYSHGNPNVMLQENQTKLDSAIGSGNYDIGHVFDTDGGGLAWVGKVCDANYKARAMTGLSTTSGETFDIDYVAHEIAHQFSANHVFNSTTDGCGGGNRNAATAFEPGSGSSIMSYSGLCGSNNLQVSSHAMFHSGSIAEVLAFAHYGAGAGCGTASSLSNTNPVVNAGADYTIPAQTPFILTGSASDSDGNTLTYAWEQMDAGTASDVGVDTGDNALIRGYEPSTSPVRTIPRLADLVSGVQAVGESLPSTSRTLNFRLQVRDGDTTTGRGTSYDDTKVKVVATGSAFAITTPTSTNLTPNAVQSVAWNVAGTDQAPINCSNVDIAITTDNGATFTDLYTNAPNNGFATVSLPASLGSAPRIRVKCRNNIFFALSATNPGVAIASQVGSTNNTGGGISISDSGGGGGSLPWYGLLLAGFVVIRSRFRK